MSSIAYIITNTQDAELAWSNTYGWCSETYDTFTEEEHATTDLPPGGEWTLVSWRVNA